MGANGKGKRRQSARRIAFVAAGLLLAQSVIHARDVGNERTDMVQAAPTFVTGDRVVVNNQSFPGFWANGSMGTVSKHPMADAPSRNVRMVRTVRGLEPYYWVVLDEARLDDDGGGPYKEAEFAGSWLLRVIKRP
jgi:hypothetical protein